MGESHWFAGRRQPSRPGFFDLLGVRGMLGRTFTAQESEPSKDRVVVRGNSLYQRHFGENYYRRRRAATTVPGKKNRQASAVVVTTACSAWHMIRSMRRIDSNRGTIPDQGGNLSNHEVTRWSLLAGATGAAALVTQPGAGQSSADLGASQVIR